LKTNSHILISSGRKLLVLLIMGSLTLGAFATLGDGKSGKDKSRKLLSTRTSAKPGSFSLGSGYNFRGKQVINFQETPNTYINLNTVVTYQKGHTTYTIPLKKKVILNNKVTFNPNAASR
jgi:hypothetical protein